MVDPPDPIPHEADTRPLGIRILVVDGDDPERERIAALLSSDGFLVDQAVSFRGACLRLENAAPYEVVVIEPSLGDRDGVELVAIVRATHATTRILLLGDVDARVAGVDGVVGKGAPLDELQARVAALVGGAP